jgi:hypothetical protein
MTHEGVDLSFLDLPEILHIVFYPRKSHIKPLAPNAKDHFIEVESARAQYTRKLLEAGFEYVCSHKDEMLFRKRK